MNLKQARAILRKEHNIKQILSGSNLKTNKGSKLNYMTTILHLSPADSSGYNICPMAKLAGCIAGCLNTAGYHSGAAKNGATFNANGRILPDNNVQRCRIRRTQAYMENRAAFMTVLAHEIALFIGRARRAGFIPTVRLNGTSDIKWEKIKVEHNGALYYSIMDCFPTVQFYDYTKIPNRRGLPDNYDLTWSYSEASEDYAKTQPDGYRMAVVFGVSKPEHMPKRFNGRRVVSGEDTDLRFLEDSDVVVGLTAKGRARQDQSGFVIR